jgi:hypothetical protein
MSDIDNIDNAKYNGIIILDHFDVGAMLNDKKIGKVTMNLDVEGKGFTKKNINTSFAGDVFQLKYNGYNYTKIIVDGSYKQPIFQGKFNINDPNLFMDFSGILDLSKKENIYDFHSKIDYANLVKLKFIKDSISVLRGDILVKSLRYTVQPLNVSKKNPRAEASVLERYWKKYKDTLKLK